MTYEDEVAQLFGIAGNRCELLGQGIANVTKIVSEAKAHGEGGASKTSEMTVAALLLSTSFDAVVATILDLGGGRTAHDSKVMLMSATEQLDRAAGIIASAELQFCNVVSALNEALTLIDGCRVYCHDSAENLKEWRPE